MRCDRTSAVKVVTQLSDDVSPGDGLQPGSECTFFARTILDFSFRITHRTGAYRFYCRHKTYKCERRMMKAKLDRFIK